MLHRKIAWLAAALSLTTAAAYGTPANAATSVLFILDSSGTMKTKVDGQPKTDTLKKMMDDMLAGLPPDTRLGLMSYGHRRKGDCSDIELIVPVGSADAATVARDIHALQVQGETPIADALLLANDALKGIAGPKMIVLVTDGAEECHGNPCGIARLIGKDADVHVDVIGFNLDNKERDAVQCIAKEGHGKYYDARDNKALGAALAEVNAELTPAGR